MVLCGPWIRDPKEIWRGDIVPDTEIHDGDDRTPEGRKTPGVARQRIGQKYFISWDGGEGVDIVLDAVNLKTNIR